MIFGENKKNFLQKQTSSIGIGFAFFIGSATLVVIILFGLWNFFTGKNGTWTTKKYYEHLPIDEGRKVKEKFVKPPRERKPRLDSSGEIECRRVLTKIFNKPFNKERPDFLNNPVTGGDYNLELDCFDVKLKLAVEYNGRQHYEFIEFFHKNKDRFLNMKYRDDMKRRMCKDEGITLIEVPYTVEVKDIEEFIRKELIKTGHL